MTDVTRSATPVTVEELDKLLAEYTRVEEEKEQLALQVTEKNKELSRIEFRVTAFLEELGRQKFESPIAKCEIKEEWRVNMPADDVAKAALFQHLRERGIFDAYATVNSQSLNALYRKDLAEAEARGEAMTFTMPGIEAPKILKRTKIKPLRKGE